jgi:hypothetical protein
VTATVKGSLLGAPADGKPVRWEAVDIYRVTDGKISEEWAADDVAAIMAQIGAFNPPWAASRLPPAACGVPPPLAREGHGSMTG